VVRWLPVWDSIPSPRPPAVTTAAGRTARGKWDRERDLGLWELGLRVDQAGLGVDCVWLPAVFSLLIEGGWRRSVVLSRCADCCHRLDLRVRPTA